MESQGHGIDLAFPANPSLEASDLDPLSRKWLDFLAEDGKARSTVRTYGADLRSFLRFAVGHGLGGWRHVDHAAAHAYLAWLHAQGLSRGLIRRRAGVLQELLEWGRDLGALAQPVIVPQVPSRARVLPHVIEPQAVDAMLREAHGGRDYFGARDAAIIAILWFCGLTAAEVCRLDMDHLATDTATLHVPASTLLAREVPIAPRALDLLRPWLLSRRSASLADASHQCALFTGGHGRRLSIDRVTRLLAYRSRQAGVYPPASARSMRASFAVRLLSAQIDEDQVRILLGHRSILSTREYQRAVSPQARSVAAFLRAIDARPEIPPA